MGKIVHQFWRENSNIFFFYFLITFLWSQNTCQNRENITEFMSQNPIPAQIPLMNP